MVDVISTCQQICASLLLAKAAITLCLLSVVINNM